MIMIRPPDEALRQEIREVIAEWEVNLLKLARLLGVAHPTLVRFMNGDALGAERIEAIRRQLRQVRGSRDVYPGPRPIIRS